MALAATIVITYAPAGPLASMVTLARLRRFSRGTRKVLALAYGYYVHTMYPVDENTKVQGSARSQKRGQRKPKKVRLSGVSRGNAEALRSLPTPRAEPTYVDGPWSYLRADRMDTRRAHGSKRDTSDCSDLNRLTVRATRATWSLQRTTVDESARLNILSTQYLSLAASGTQAFGS